MYARDTFELTDVVLGAGMFEKVQHVLLVGTGGAVPDYSDYRRHVRLGDVVVSAPLTSSTSHQRSAVASDAYICCDTFSHDEKTNEYNFQTRGIKPSDSTLQVRKLASVGCSRRVFVPKLAFVDCSGIDFESHLPGLRTLLFVADVRFEAERVE